MSIGSFFGGLAKKALPILGGAALGPLGALGGGLLAGAMGGGKKKPAAAAGAQPGLGTDFSQAIKDARTRRNSANSALDQNLQTDPGAGFDEYAGTEDTFDASQAYEKYAGGALDDARLQLTQGLDETRELDAGSGRLDTGFFDKDRGEVFQNVNRGLANSLTGQAVNAAGIDASYRGGAQTRKLQAISGAAGARGDRTALLAGRAANEGGEYSDLLSGGLDRETAEANAQKQSKASKTSGILGLIGKGIEVAGPGIAKKFGIGG